MASISTLMLLVFLFAVVSPLRIFKTVKQRLHAETLRQPTRRRLLTALLLNLLLVPADAGKDYYATLGVPKKANKKQIKRAYKKQAMRWHPDKNQKSGDKEKATTKFQEIAEAYETLTDPKKRELYDLGGEEAVKGQPQGPPSRNPGMQRGNFTGRHFTGTHFTQGGGRPDIDPAMFRHFQQRSGGNFRQAEGGGGDPFSFFRGMGGVGQGGFGQGQTPFGPGGMGGFGQGGPSFSQAKQTKKASQGKAFFVQDGGAVRELRFMGHETEIQKLQNEANVAVLFYASGGRSCPKACHQIRTHYKDFAAARQKHLPIVAVQCTHRLGLCAKYADKFPAVVLFSKGASQPHVLSEGKAASAAELLNSFDRAFVKGTFAQQGAEELAAKHFPSVMAELAGDPCDGQFCLLLLEHRSTPSSARKALKDAARMLKDEPVKAFYILEDKHPDFVRAFNAPAWHGLWGKRAATQALIYRPRRQTYELFNGDSKDGEALKEFALRAIHRGTPLPHRLLETPKLSV